METSRDLTERVRRLERLGFGLLLLGAIGIAGCLASARSRTASDDGWLHVRGVIVEDELGRPRVVLGAPIGKLAGRARSDETVGLIVLSPDGRDVLELGRVGGPQMGGKVQPRMSPATGLTFADARGNERGGIGVFDNGQAGWGLDYDGGEGLVALVDPERKIAGFVLQAPSGENTQRAALLTTPNGTTFELSDGAARPRFQVEAPTTGDARVQVLDAEGKASFDATR
ncbi:MAG: hypothetical protein K8S98_09435 [Planctomycetes bacterium]|nr:hypothetical protein [Planctomycetota bacterium]